MLFLPGPHLCDRGARLQGAYRALPAGPVGLQTAVPDLYARLPHPPRRLGHDREASRRAPTGTPPRKKFGIAKIPEGHGAVRGFRYEYVCATAAPRRAVFDTPGAADRAQQRVNGESTLRSAPASGVPPPPIIWSYNFHRAGENK